MFVDGVDARIYPVVGRVRNRHKNRDIVPAKNTLLVVAYGTCVVHDDTKADQDK